MPILLAMSEVNEELIKRVAELSRLELTPEEVSEYVTSIGNILGHVEQLKQVRVEGVEPMYYGIDDPIRLREDRVIEMQAGTSGEPKILESAPEILEGGFKVPQIVG